MNTKTYNHAVIFNGVFYPANTPIAIVEEKAADEEVKAANDEVKAGGKSDNKPRSRKPKSAEPTK